jgi:hypothetical protein
MEPGNGTFGHSAIGESCLECKSDRDANRVIFRATSDGATNRLTFTIDQCESDAMFLGNQGSIRTTKCGTVIGQWRDTAAGRAGRVGYSNLLRIFAGFADMAFVDKLYQNPLHRSSESAGERGWMAALNVEAPDAEVSLGCRTASTRPR